MPERRQPPCAGKCGYFWILMEGRQVGKHVLMGGILKTGGCFKIYNIMNPLLK
jgi:hypothetical protein